MNALWCQHCKREICDGSCKEKYTDCPFKGTGFTLEYFKILPSMIIGSDGRCICTVDKKCVNVDKSDNNRCTLAELRLLDQQAMTRYAWQSGE